MLNNTRINQKLPLPVFIFVVIRLSIFSYTDFCVQELMDLPTYFFRLNVILTKYIVLNSNGNISETLMVL